MNWTVKPLGAALHNASTKYAKLIHKTGHSIYLTGWFQGCGLNAMEQMSDLNYIPASEWAEFRKTLRGLSVGLTGGGYNNRRWLFTLSTRTKPTDLLAELVKHSRKIDQFPNWAHGPSDIIMYLLEFPE